jgi:hypothetical protein
MAAKENYGLGYEDESHRLCWVEEYDADSYTPFEYIETFSYQHILKVHNNHSKNLLNHSSLA